MSNYKKSSVCLDNVHTTLSLDQDMFCEYIDLDMLSTQFREDNMLRNADMDEENKWRIVP